jgi:hypothetical protein
VIYIFKRRREREREREREIMIGTKTNIRMIYFLETKHALRYVYWYECTIIYSRSNVTNLLHTIGTNIFFASSTVRHCDDMICDDMWWDEMRWYEMIWGLVQVISKKWVCSIRFCCVALMEAMGMNFCIVITDIYILFSQYPITIDIQ